ncbi:FGGY family carbohydrate kinase [Mahella sp.]|uniref:xylulokinase n=1 Tax=Mahella sp. TaxID=2798721 RepID=UPI0025C1BA81|nr:FGGY family carbohydrate kinase [Mahella sp.]MBZ4664780.1 Carbohydrate kinase [Mahella sp.]
MISSILTLDLGTTACKAIFFDLSGNVLADGNCEYPTAHPTPMAAEQKADDWWEAVVKAVRQAEDKLAEPVGVEAIGLSSQRETIVPVDRFGTPLCDAIMWMDRRSKDYANQMAEHFGKEDLHNMTGMIPDSTFSATKIAWLKEHQPDAFAKTAYFLQPRDYICFKLTDNFILDYSLASRTMMLDVRKLQWRSEILDYLGINPEQLPPLVWSDQVIGHVTNKAASALGLNSGIPVVAGGGDRQCEALGAGIFGTRAMESTGTTSNISFAADNVPEVIDSRVVCSVHTLRDHWLIEQGLTTSGSIMQWFRDRVYYSDGDARDKTSYKPIDAEIMQSPPSANKLLTLPFFMGAKATRWNPDARGAVFGLTLGHTKGDIGRSIMEGVAFELKACLDVLSDMALSPDELVIMGGGSKAELWNRIKADVYGLPIKVPRIREAASLGAMALAGKGVGIFDDAAQAALRLNPIVGEYSPNRENNEFYRQYYGLYNDLYKSLEQLYKRLEEL